MQLNALNDFNWDTFSTTAGNLFSKAADIALQYKQAQLAADTAKAQAQAQSQAAIARATLQPGQGSMFNYGFGNSTRGAALPNMSLPNYSQSTSSNMVPILLIGGFGLAAAFLLLRK